MTLFGLADQLGISHKEARRIASGLRPGLLHAHKSANLSHYEAAQLRPLFLRARPAPHPTMPLSMIPRPEREEEAVNEKKLGGITLALVSQNTGIGESKLKMIASRHEELQAPPYSAKAGGNRVFFPPFVDWLKKYEGEEASHGSHTSVTPVTPVRLPSGAQLHELRLMAEKDRISKADLRTLLGLAPEGIALAAPPEKKAAPEIAARAFETIGELFEEKQA